MARTKADLVPRVRGTVRQAGRRAARVARAARTRARRRAQRPVLSVVIPVYGIVEYLPMLLDSVLGQDLGGLGDLEVVAVDDSSTDGSLAVLREYARRDHRVRVLVQPNAGQGAARNNGVSHVRGEFLTFIDGDDIIPPGSLRHMLARLRESGSDFCIGDVRRFRYGDHTPTAWSRVVHARDRTGVTLEEFPEAVLDIITGNRMFRTAFWRERGIPFKPGIPYQDHVPMLAALVRAEGFDVLSRVTYHWRSRENATSTTQQKGRLSNLTHRVAVKADAWALLQDEAPRAAQDAWLARTLEVDFPPFIPHGVAGAADYRDLLASLNRTYLDLARERPVEQVLDRVTTRQKIRAQLVVDQRWDDVAAADLWFDDAGPVPPTHGADGAVVADLPDELTACSDLPSDVLRLSTLETNLEAGLTQVAGTPGGVRLTGWAVVRGLAVPGPVAPSLWLEDGSGALIDLDVTPVPAPAADQWGRQRFAAYADGGFEALVASSSLPARPATWRLRVATSYDSVAREGVVLHRSPRSSAARPRAAVVDLGGHPFTLAPRWDDADGLVLDVRPGGGVDQVADAPGTPGPRVVGVDLVEDVLRVSTSAGVGGPVLRGPGHVRLMPVAYGERGAAYTLVEQGRAVPPGTYRLPLPLHPAYAERLTERVVGDRVAVECGRSDDDTLLVQVQAPLPDHVLGVSAQERLQTVSRSSGAALVDEVLLVPGSPTGGDQWALAAALGSGSGSTWAVPDFSVDVPAGCRPVVVRSPEWYAAVDRSRLVIGDEPLGAWSRSRPGQRRVWTGGSHPWAALGRARWTRDGYTEARIEREIVRVNRDWDTVLAPSDEVAGWYADLAGFEGTVLVTGSPRTDALVAPADDRREQVRDRLGIDPARTVVLLGHEMPRLDELLGEEHAVLVRDPLDRVPDTDLLLAADVAVLDTGALRFDWAVTGKPVLFHVPHLDADLHRLGPVVPWAETAPGPSLATAEEVAEALGDLGALTTSYAGERERFRTRFHPLADGHATARVLTALTE